MQAAADEDILARALDLAAQEAERPSFMLFREPNPRDRKLPFSGSDPGWRASYAGVHCSLVATGLPRLPVQ
jgi:hypothetical protein